MFTLGMMKRGIDMNLQVVARARRGRASIVKESCILTVWQIYPSLE
jgi:hypothetical protein